MPSAIEFVNEALQDLGAEPVASIDPADSPNAATASYRYPRAVERLLGMHSWRFATGRVQLSQIDSVAPLDTNWTYQYALPATMLRFVRTDVPDGSWMLYRDPESGYMRLYSNETAVWADIVENVDPALFPPHFQTALVAQLTSDLALPVTRRADIAKIMAAKARAALSAAITQDWNQQPMTEMDDGNIIADARYG